jgi:hypothetical protein
MQMTTCDHTIQNLFQHAHGFGNKRFGISRELHRYTPLLSLAMSYALVAAAAVYPVNREKKARTMA